MVQNTIVALLVMGCFVYALWTLAPKAPRGRLAAALLKLPLPLVLQGPLNLAVRRQGGCACDGCDGSVSVKAKAGQTKATQQVPAGYKPVNLVRGSYSRKLPRS